MIHPRKLCALMAASLVAACTGEPPTAFSTDALDPPQTLRLLVPSLEAGQLVAAGGQDAPAASDGPAPVEYADEDPPLLGIETGDGSDADISDYLDEVGSIYDEYTKVGFGPGYAFSYGEHKYQGNKGRVETTVGVSYEDQPIGAQTAATEKYDMFLLDVGTVHFISATARFYTDKTCGLTVRGFSQHSAWWEWMVGGGAMAWGKASKTSDAPAVSQGGCPVEPIVGGSGGSSVTTCYFWVTYDLDTGEVYDVTLLYCEGGDIGG